MLATLRGNLQTIYAGLRDDGGFHGRLVALTYYVLDYTDREQIAVVGALNAVVSEVTLAQPAGRVADGFGAFAAASAPFGGSPCAAGLLIRRPDNLCDIHPSLAGQALLALTIRSVVRKD